MKTFNNEVFSCGPRKNEKEEAAMEAKGCLPETQEDLRETLGDIIENALDGRSKLGDSLASLEAHYREQKPLLRKFNEAIAAASKQE